MCGVRISTVCDCDSDDDPHLRPKGEFKNVSGDVFAKAKQMVLHGDIAPFEDGCDCEDCVGGAQQLEECSICFLSFPALNRTKCCSKGICSNCFFAVKTTDYRHEDAPPRTLRHLLLGNCPFCKCKPFEVQFKGRRSAEERQRELEEDKRVQLALRRKREEDIRSSLSGSVLSYGADTASDSSSSSSSSDYSTSSTYLDNEETESDEEEEDPHEVSRNLIDVYNPDGRTLWLTEQERKVVRECKLCWSCLKPGCKHRTCPLRTRRQVNHHRTHWRYLDSINTTTDQSSEMQQQQQVGSSGSQTFPLGNQVIETEQPIADLMLNAAILESINRSESRSRAAEQQATSGARTSNSNSRNSSSNSRTCNAGHARGQEQLTAGFNVMNPFESAANTTYRIVF